LSERRSARAGCSRPVRRRSADRLSADCPPAGRPGGRSPGRIPGRVRRGGRVLPRGPGTADPADHHRFAPRPEVLRPGASD